MGAPRPGRFSAMIVYYILMSQLLTASSFDVVLIDILLMVIFSLSLKTWAIIILWFVFAPIAHGWDLGPLYILGTAFCIIFLNLGQRQPGDMSAYSIFNDDFRELPGTLNADRLDRDIRAGQI